MYIWLALVIWFGLGLIMIASILLLVKLVDLIERQYVTGSWRISLTKQSKWTEQDKVYLLWSFICFPYGAFVWYANFEEGLNYYAIIRRQRAITRRKI